MATSGSSNFTQNRDDIIKDALILLGVAYEDEDINNGTKAFAARMLNKMVKAWNGQGLHIWAYQEGAIILDKDTVKYTLDTTTDTNVCKAGGLIKAEIGAAEAAAQTTLTVDSSAGMAASDVIFIELDDGTFDETTISSVTDSTTIVVASGLTSAAASGNHIYVYTTADDAVTKVKQVTNVRRRDADGNDTELVRLSRDDYYRIVDKDQESVPTSYFVEKGRDQTVIYVWPEPNSRKDYLFFTYLRSIEDFDAATDDADFPQEWLEALTYNLAIRLAPAFGKDQKLASLAPMAQESLSLAAAWDDEEADVEIVPEMF